MTAAATGPCECCGRQNAILGPVRAPDGLPAANRICAICLRHLGDVASIARRREAQHAKMWAEDQREALEALEERHGRVLASLQQQVAQLQQTLDDRPERVVVQNLDLQEVRAAHDARDAAYRSRDTAYQALCELRLLHHETGDGQCRCGRRVDRCDVAGIVDRYPALRLWEDKQAEFLRRGLPHLLPDGHPAVLDRRSGVPDVLLDHVEAFEQQRDA